MIMVDVKKSFLQVFACKPKCIQFDGARSMFAGQRAAAARHYRQPAAAAAASPAGKAHRLTHN